MAYLNVYHMGSTTRFQKLNMSYSPYPVDIPRGYPRASIYKDGRVNPALYEEFLNRKGALL